jgi:hypothetical protein
MTDGQLGQCIEVLTVEMISQAKATRLAIEKVQKELDGLGWQTEQHRTESGNHLIQMLTSLDQMNEDARPRWDALHILTASINRSLRTITFLLLPIWLASVVYLVEALWPLAVRLYLFGGRFYGQG